MNFGKLLYQSVLWKGLNLTSIFLLNLLISRTFGASQYGQLFFFINAAALALLLVSFSAETGLSFYTSKKLLNPSGTVVVAFLWSAGGAFVAYFLVKFFSGDALQFDSGNHTLSCVLYITGLFLLTFFSALFSSKFHYIIPNAIVVVVNVVLCIFILLAGSNFTIFTDLFFLSFFLQGILTALGYVLLVKPGTISLLSQSEFLVVVKYAAKAFIANVLFFLVYRIDYWFVHYFVADINELGNYIQISRLGQMFLIIPGIIASTVFSVTAEGSNTQMPQRVQQLSRIIFFVAVSCCVVLLLCGKWLFPFLFGSSFDNMYTPFLFLAPGIIAIATLYPFTAYYSGKNEIAKNIAGSLVALVIIVLGDYILIPKLGINGAAIISSIGYISYEVYILYHFKKETGVAIADSFIIKKGDFNFLKKS